MTYNNQMSTSFFTITSKRKINLLSVSVKSYLNFGLKLIEKISFPIFNNVLFFFEKNISNFFNYSNSLLNFNSFVSVASVDVNESTNELKFNGEFKTIYSISKKIDADQNSLKKQKVFCSENKKYVRPPIPISKSNKLKQNSCHNSNIINIPLCLDSELNEWGFFVDIEIEN